MQLMNCKRYKNALTNALSNLDLSALHGKTILITGATGLLGSCLVDMLLHYGSIRVIAVGRNSSYAKQRFGPGMASYSFIAKDVCTPFENIRETVDYIIHAASNADPVSMAADPVNTLMSNVQGTKNLLDYGRSHSMKRFLFVSSGEIYGQPNAAMDDFTEDYCGPLDLSNPRCCYPSGKRAAEVLCQSYVRQYQTDAVIVRPCHLFGPTMTRQDSRAVAEFLWSAAERRDIVMKSPGLQERSYCYVLDAAGAVLTVLLHGICGNAYNIADRQYQMQISIFARKAAEAGGCHVLFSESDKAEQEKYSKVSRAVLDAAHLEKLGWKPQSKDAIRETVEILRESEETDELYR